VCVRIESKPQISLNFNVCAGKHNNIHVAIGYGLANSIMLEGPDGVIIVDTLESVEVAREVKREFDRISGGKPVKALIYTHNHADHVFGAVEFASTGNGKTRVVNTDIVVYAHQSTATYLDRVLGVTNKIIFRRSMRQFGTYVQGTDDFINCGIGPYLLYTRNHTAGVIRPNKVFDEKLLVDICGFKLELHHCPGETEDQSVVWLPDESILLGADNMYKAFPNLYAIRGTAHRDTLKWVHSLDAMRDFKAETLVPSHTQPIVGKELVASTLKSYRDAIKYVHDQTVFHMNQGLHVDDIVQRVHLPPKLASHPYLQEFYGTVEWSVRSIFTGYLGWFSGDAKDLFPLDRQSHRERMIALAGSKELVQKQLDQAFATQDWQWALTLADVLQENSARAAALRGLASIQISANARNYLLTQALESEGLQIRPSLDQRRRVIDTAPLSNLFRAMTVNLKAAKALDTDQRIFFNFHDVNQVMLLHVHSGIADVSVECFSGVCSINSDREDDIIVKLTSKVWRDILGKRRSPVAAYISSELIVEKGSSIRLATLLKKFQSD